VAEAQHADAQAFAVAQAEHAQQMEQFAWEQRMANGIIGGDVAAYRAAIDHLAPFGELLDSGMNVGIETLRPDVGVFRCIVADDSVIPRDEKKLTAAGKLSVKPLAAGTYWATYQDFVCGCALRVAREVVALLPLQRVIVNVAVHGIDTSTGHHALLTILAISVPRETVGHLRYHSLDPSDALANFTHRMKFKKSTGFEIVEPITADESFVTTGGRRR
jgi:hypothetical protein